MVPRLSVSNRFVFEATAINTCFRRLTRMGRDHSLVKREYDYGDLAKGYHQSQGR